MQEEIFERQGQAGFCKFDMVISFNSMDDMFRAFEMLCSINANGITSIKCVDRRVFEKVQKAVKRKEEKRAEKQRRVLIKDRNELANFLSGIQEGVK